MPPDIVARARAAMRQASDPTPEPAGLPAPDSSGAEPTPGTEVAVAAVRAVTHDAVDSDPAFEEAAAPYVAPSRHPSPPDGGPAPLPPSENEKSWSGYDPDYVADQLVTLIHARATAGWRSRLGLRPSKAERERSELQAAMCVNFGQPVKIVVANPRGSAGKTSLTVLLAGTLGLARGCGVCAFEDHELRGVMALRTVANGFQRTTRDFINDLAQMTPDQVRHADLTRYMRHQHAGNFDAMVTSRNFEKQLSGDEYRAAAALLERFYQVIVVDTANNEAHEAFRAAVEDATVLVVPIKWRPTHIDPAAQMLNDMAALSPRHRLLVQNAVVAASNGPGEVIPGTRELARPMFDSLAHTVIEIPPDPHIDADRPILHHQLRPRTRRALDRLGAAVAAAAVKNIREMRTTPRELEER